MTSLVSAAPGGASMPGTWMAGPPGCASGTAGRSNRSRSRPGWSLGGTICAPGGTTCATAANETLTIAKAAAMARTHASMPPTLDERVEILRYGETRSQRRQLSCFDNSSRCFKKVTPDNKPENDDPSIVEPVELANAAKVLPQTITSCGSHHFEP